MISRASGFVYFVQIVPSVRYVVRLKKHLSVEQALIDCKLRFKR
jgi:hypothetical protein